MIHFFVGEKWKEFLNKKHLKFKYAVSNFGRLISFTDKIEDGRLLKGSIADGYPTFSYVTKKGKGKVLFIRKIVAENFLPEKKEDQEFVLLLDFNRKNNLVSNLKWATRAEMLLHYKKSPAVIQAQKNLQQLHRDNDGKKLTTTQVMHLKKMIFNPNRKTRLSLIAKQFGISEMQLYRIKSGENWGHVKV
ncbi:MAG: NUMOD4 domain-containing protein [Bacteroidia bacterium]